MVEASQLNPFANIQVGSLSTYAGIALVIAIAVIVLGLIGFIIYIFYVRKSYWINIEVTRRVGGSSQRIATYTAREVPMGMAGDKLWKVAPAGLFKFKTIKWLPVGKLQSAPALFKYHIREDGEWINYIDEDLDEKSKQMKIKFVHEDMRLQRLATDRLLEQRLMKKTFWEQWGNTIMTVILFLVIAVSVVIIFYQFSKLLEDMSPLVDTIDRGLKMVEQSCVANRSVSGGGGLIPVP